MGSEEADKFYAQCAIDAGVAFVNALPVFIASDPVWAKKFEDAGVPIVGDDIKSQVGATITHRVMAKLFEDRGVALDRTYQLNVGGNMDFKNMLERERLESKKVSKTQAVTSNLTGSLAGRSDDRNVHIGPSDYVAWLDDRKWAYVRLEGRAFGDVPLNLEYKLEVWDSPNSAGIIIDAIRAAKIAMDRGIGGPIISASSYLMKSPPVQLPDDEGRAAWRRSSAASDPDLRNPARPPRPRSPRPNGGPPACRCPPVAGPSGAGVSWGGRPTRRAGRPRPPRRRGPSSSRSSSRNGRPRPTSRPGPMPRISMIWLPSRSGRIEASSSSSDEPRRSAPRARRRYAAAGRPCAGCGSCSRRGSGRAAARAGRRRRGRSGVRRSRSTRPTP